MLEEIPPYRPALVIVRDEGTYLSHDERSNAELVVTRHPDGQWSVQKDRHGGATGYLREKDLIEPGPWDRLPSRIKAAVVAIGAV